MTRVCGIDEYDWQSGIGNSYADGRRGQVLADYEDWIASRSHTKPSETGDGLALGRSALGLCSEAGELAGLCYSAQTGRRPLDRAEAALELGDCLYYLVQAAIKLDVTVEQLIALNKGKLESRDVRGKDHEYDLRLARTVLR